MVTFKLFKIVSALLIFLDYEIHDLLNLLRLKLCSIMALSYADLGGFVETWLYRIEFDRFISDMLKPIGRDDISPLWGSTACHIVFYHGDHSSRDNQCDMAATPDCRAWPTARTLGVWIRHYINIGIGRDDNFYLYLVMKFNPLASLCIAMLRLYQITLSPMFTAIGIRCRHEPTCSSYSIEAIKRHGVWPGLWMTFARLCRCQPFGSHGVDNVPEHITKPSFWAPWQYGVWHVKQNETCHDHDHIPWWQYTRLW